MNDEWIYRQKDTLHVFDVRCLSLWYGNVQVLHELSLSFIRGHVTAVIGPSGCGKTSFLKVLNRMTDLEKRCRWEGTVIYDNMDISRIQDVNCLRRAVGMIPQIPNPFLLSVYENLAFPLRACGVEVRQTVDEQVESALRRADVWEEVKDCLTMDARKLSAGQQQRLCIARALVMKPDVLLFDEPASAMDPVAMMRLEDLFQELKKMYSLIVVTHNMQQAARCADETALLVQGRLVEYGTSDDFFSMPKKRETENYITGRFSQEVRSGGKDKI